MKYLCEIYVSSAVGHCPEKAAVVQYTESKRNPGERVRVIVCESHMAEAFPNWESLLVPVYVGLYGLVQDEGIIGGRIDPLAEYKHQDGPLKGMWRQTLQTLRENLQYTAYLSTPGAPVRAHDSEGSRLRPNSEFEAAAFRNRFAAHARELSLRDPEGFAAWEKAYLAWKGDKNPDTFPKVEAYAQKK